MDAFLFNKSSIVMELSSCTTTLLTENTLKLEKNKKQKNFEPHVTRVEPIMVH